MGDESVNGKLEQWEQARLVGRHRLWESLERHREENRRLQDKLLSAFLEKEEKTQERLREWKDSQPEHTRQHNGKLDAVDVLLAREQEKRDAAFTKKVASLAEHRKAWEANREERSSKVASDLTKSFGKRDQGLENVRKQKVEKRKAWVEKLAQDRLQVRDQKLAGDAQKRGEFRSVMEELVRKNRERLMMSNGFAREELLCRVQARSADVPASPQRSALALDTK